MLFAQLLGFAPGIVIFHLGYLLHAGMKRNGSPSLKGIVLYREQIPVWQHFFFVPFWALSTSRLKNGKKLPIKAYVLGVKK